MNEETIRAFEFKRNEMRAQKVIKGLKSRKMNGYYAANREEALKIALELIPEGSEVNMGGCMSAIQIGLFDALKNGPYNFVDRDDTDDRRGAMIAAFNADVFLASANAITEDGIMVNIDGAANRIAALAFGPRKLVHIVGMNKVCADVHDAIKRARNVAAPINAQRFGLSTPCSKTGACGDCKSEDCICCQMLITRFAMDPDRVHVILVNEDLGF